MIDWNTWNSFSEEEKNEIINLVFNDNKEKIPEYKKDIEENEDNSDYFQEIAESVHYDFFSCGYDYYSVTTPVKIKK